MSINENEKNVKESAATDANKRRKSEKENIKLDRMHHTNGYKEQTQSGGKTNKRPVYKQRWFYPVIGCCALVIVIIQGFFILFTISAVLTPSSSTKSVSIGGASETKEPTKTGEMEQKEKSTKKERVPAQGKPKFGDDQIFNIKDEITLGDFIFRVSNNRHVSAFVGDGYTLVDVEIEALGDHKKFRGDIQGVSADGYVSQNITFVWGGGVTSDDAIFSAWDKTLNKGERAKGYAAFGFEDGITQLEITYNGNKILVNI